MVGPKLILTFINIYYMVNSDRNKILNAINEITLYAKAHPQEIFNAELEADDTLRSYLETIQAELGLTALQAALLGVIIDEAAGRDTTFKAIASAWGCTYLSLLSYTNDFHLLRDKGYIRIDRTRIMLSADALSALMDGRPYEKPSLSGKSTAVILAKMKRYFEDVYRGEMSDELLLEEIELLIAANPQTSLAKGVKKHIDPLKLEKPERYIFYLALFVTYYCDTEFTTETIRNHISDDSPFEYLNIFFESTAENVLLVKNKIIEPYVQNGMAEIGSFQIRKDIADDCLRDAPYVRREETVQLVDSARFAKKQLFYNEKEAEQVARLSVLLSPENLNNVFVSMQNKGFRTGFTCLFYGVPGTGKTETVLQLAKETGRKILRADAAAIRDKYVGESEKNARRLFRDYRAALEENELSPILLLNEADAIIGRRLENQQRSSDKMENAIQNIFLEELEQFSGILIATTNLTQNLDPAFERRFLFKIRFDKPEESVRARIWQSMIPELTDADAMELAIQYGFSGGQIENVARKRDIAAILDGMDPSFDLLRSYCNEETLQHNTGTRRSIGFC